MARKNNISYTEPSQPSFIKAFKRKAGYKDGPTLSDKFEPLSKDDDIKELDPKSELLELIQNEQLSVTPTISCDYTKEELKDMLEGKDPSLVSESKAEKKKEISKLPYDEKRDGKILYRPPVSSKIKRTSEDSQTQPDNCSSVSKKKKERDSSKRMLTCIPSDEENSSDDD